MKKKIEIEDALKHLHDCDYRGRASSIESLAGALTCDLEKSAELLASLRAKDLVTSQASAFQLTPKGLEYAREVVRAHRLYETYLARKTGLSETEWHLQAEKMEHLLSGREIDEIAEELGHPRYDPHGDPIPTADGNLPPNQALPLTECPIGWEGRVAHLEDEPKTIFQSLIEAGLAPGMQIKVAQRQPETLLLELEGRQTTIRRSAAENVMVSSFHAEESYDPEVGRLSDLKLHESASIVELSPACRGPERNRLLDLGIVPGTEVTLTLTSPSGSPNAYLIRGATIALRREQADKIITKKRKGTTDERLSS
ncbi:metal-dependent transcriptional regulator [Pelagicoccus albus]|uniref:Metal-dependent transcriptional regulator n=1 Tax=Pelagicoccus albus TaxID=415222 RepID=A0A7X1E6Q1_9BACT|nr:metal-dependent transcriptional regulator [Pelagicoccus albus]MBC2604504.1 metal-dependent transcriptional regulator [Pelagicoccus albus]